MIALPAEVVQIRRELCAQCDIEDACASCAHGHWGQYEASKCAREEATVIIPARQLAAVIAKPGDLLARVIFEITGERGGFCACADRQRQMNARGWLWCWRNRALVIGWLCEEAAKRGHMIAAPRVAPLLRAALREALRGKRR
jgi:hypothetical protein